jgi:hypothetical protein
MRKLLGWVSSIIGILAAAMMFAANISFDQARSNLASWLPQTLLDRFPTLQSVAADQATSLIWNRPRHFSH